MKLRMIKQKIKNKCECKNIKTERLHRIKKEYRSTNKGAELIEKELKVIGITGSRGKSTTALLIHEYLKSLGYKSILYSSVKIDSPVTNINPNVGCEVSFKNEEDLLNIIEEADVYGAEYLVLEVNENTLAKGFLNDEPFDVRVLTNLNSKHNLEEYTEEEYVNLKKSFFKDIEEECKCIYGFQDYSKDLLDELLQLNKYSKYIASSNYIANVKGVNSEDVTCLLTKLDSNIDGMKLEFKLNGKAYNLDTNLLMSYNALNILTVLTTLDVLEVLDVQKFEEVLNNLVIPGRAEVFKANGRLIVIDTHLPAMLDCLKTLKKRDKVKKIKVVVGATGYGYKNWEKRFKTEEFAKQRKEYRRYAMNLLKDVVDYVYLTESDNGKENVMDICTELQSYLDKNISSTIIVDREKAIRQAILESQEGDVVFISGRGNRRVLCNGETTMKLLKDSEAVEKVLKELKWK